MHLLGFIIRIYHVARSSESQRRLETRVFCDDTPWRWTDRLTLKMQGIRFSETSVIVHQSTQRAVREEVKACKHRWRTSSPANWAVLLLLLLLLLIRKGVLRQAEVAQGVPGRLRSRIFLTFQHYKGGRSSAKSTWPPLPQEKSMVLTFRSWVDLRAHGSVGGTTEKIFSDPTGNRFRDRPTSSAVP